MSLSICSGHTERCQIEAVDAGAHFSQHADMSSRKDWGNSTLKNRLEHLRTIRDVSQNELERRAGLGRGQISRLASRAKMPSADVLGRISSAWVCSHAWLAYGRGQPDDLSPVDLPSALEEALERKDGPSAAVLRAAAAALATEQRTLAAGLPEDEWRLFLDAVALAVANVLRTNRVPMALPAAKSTKNRTRK